MAEQHTKGGTGLLITGRKTDPSPTSREDASSRADEFMRLLADVKDYAIFMLARDGTVTSWNLGAERLEGYGADEIIGQHFSRFYTEEDRRAAKPHRHLQLAVEHGHLEDEGGGSRRMARTSGRTSWSRPCATMLAT